MTHYMQKAIDLSLQNVKNGTGGPFGAVIVMNNAIIATGVNQVTATHDPTAHAEMVAIRAACKELKTFQLTGCTLYTSCEPCPMCLGAIFWARLDAVYYANTKHDAASIGFDDAFIYEQIAVELELRTIPMKKLMREQALEAFRAWQESVNKVNY